MEMPCAAAPVAATSIMSAMHLTEKIAALLGINVI
jgi:hypothetical protein